ncbi:hypothetical protein F4778DRAFT_70397 [Xylariomycetidae sp. FL2044]|nr:hypothetical protein F4778DRAFT_70397 [Xylariomycetidae sp. FL2044]
MVRVGASRRPIHLCLFLCLIQPVNDTLLRSGVATMVGREEKASWPLACSWLYVQNKTICKQFVCVSSVRYGTGEQDSNHILLWLI